MKAFIHTPTNDLKASREFYTKLGFKEISAEGPTLFSDGQFIIEVNPDRFARAGIKFFRNNWERLVDLISNNTPLHKIDGGHAFADPSGCWIYLMDGDGPKHEISGNPESKLGKFAGLSLESTNPAKSVELWSILGYTISMGDIDSGWVALTTDGCPGVSIMKPLMCPHLFFNPSLTYFNGKEGNPVVIDNVRKAGIPITEEITHFNDQGIVDNIIIRDPGGYGFFLFND